MARSTSPFSPRASRPTEYHDESFADDQLSVKISGHPLEGKPEWVIQKRGPIVAVQDPHRQREEVLVGLGQAKTV